MAQGVNKEEIEYIAQFPTAAEYLSLRRSVGWHMLPKEVAEIGLDHSLYMLCARQGKKLVGCGRIVGDGAIYFYIQDLIIHPRYQGQGLGTRVMKKLMAYIDCHARQGSFVGLMAAPGLEDFYGHFGFTCFPEDSPGMQIWMEY